MSQGHSEADSKITRIIERATHNVILFDLADCEKIWDYCMKNYHTRYEECSLRFITL